jgi:hypothetical protein
VTVTVPELSIERAFQTNLVEENERPLACTAHAVRLVLRPFAIGTIRMAARR